MAKRSNNYPENYDELWQQFESVGDSPSLTPDAKHEFQESLTHLKQKGKLSMLLTGKTGSGKSTLTNGIIGISRHDYRAAREGDGIAARGTTKVTKYETKIKDVSVTVWDSPGLQDGTPNQDDYVQQMKANCSTVDMVLYCIKVSDTRFSRGDDNPDVVAMKKLTKGFGVEDFWRKTVIILSFANTLESFNVEWEDLNEADKAKAFNAKIQEWEHQIKLILKEDIGIQNEIVEGIKVIPAGHAAKPHLPGHEYWLSHLWFRCLFSIGSCEARCALWQINCSRFKKPEEVTESSFSGKLEEQPLVVTENIIGKALTIGLISSGSFIGGVLAGPFGVFVGAGIGAIFGRGIAKLLLLN